MTTRLESGTGHDASVISAVRERPLLFVTIAASLLACVVISVLQLGKAGAIEARLRSEIVTIDTNTDDPDNLIRSTSVSPEALRAAILGASGDGNTRPSGSAWDQDLWVERSTKEGEFVVGFDTSDVAEAQQWLDDLITAFADAANDERAQQKIEVMAWTMRREASWRGRIDQAKAAIVDSPYDPDLERNGGPTRGEKLLRLMIDAMTEVRTATWTDNQSLGAATDIAGDDGSDLALAEARLNDALARLEAGQAAQLEYGTALKQAETGLAQLRLRTALLIGDRGLLARPAVTVLETASAAIPVIGRHLGGTPIWLPLSVLVLFCLAVALGATTLVSRLKPAADIAAGAYLNDANWPLPQGARRELSI